MGSSTSMETSTLKKLVWRFPTCRSAIKIPIKAYQGQVVHLGCDVLIGIVKVQITLLHGLNRTEEACQPKMDKYHGAINEHFLNEEEKHLWAPKSGEDDANGMYGKARDEEAIRRNLLQELPYRLRLLLPQ